MQLGRALHISDCGAASSTISPRRFSNFRIGTGYRGGNPSLHLAWCFHGPCGMSQYW